MFYLMVILLPFRLTISSETITYLKASIENHFVLEATGF